MDELRVDDNKANLVSVRHTTRVEWGDVHTSDRPGRLALLAVETANSLGRIELPGGDVTVRVDDIAPRLDRCPSE